MSAPSLSRVIAAMEVVREHNPEEYASLAELVEGYASLYTRPLEPVEVFEARLERIDGKSEAEPAKPKRRRRPRLRVLDGGAS